MRKPQIWVGLAAVLILVIGTTSVVAQDASGGTHTVQPGETLFRIAQQYGVTVDELAFANGITNPDLVFAGQVLTIPNGAEATGGGQTEYTVAAGDTLFRIARNFNTTVDALVQLNNLTNPDQIEVGQVLVIPGTGGPVDASTPAPADTPTPQETLTHTVQPGETLFRIGLQYNTTVPVLVELNGLANPNVIFAGQVLTIQAGTAATPEPEGEGTPTEEATEEATETPVTPTEEATEEATETPETPTPDPTPEATDEANEPHTSPHE
ncbi:MAG: LysM peptidoglycan-binding domain-containing protein, partial [Chloroflexi bacterium]|nr:LysM peptidoglycan-binding domain-containing protein [Chloroflexota bacterium]